MWNVLTTAIKPHGSHNSLGSSNVYKELKRQAKKRVSTDSCDSMVHWRYREFLNDLVKVANDDAMDLLVSVKPLSGRYF